MNINRHNYEEYFLLYVDNELSAEDRGAVERFVAGQPDLEEELTMLRESVLHPNTREVFSNKELLLKNPAFVNPVNESNYEEFFVLYGDNELTTDENDFVELFVYKHPQYENEFELVQKARVTPDPLIAFPDKTRLYRSEKDEKPFVVRWWKLAAAAVILLFAGAIGWNTLVKSPPVTKNPIAVIKDTPPNQDRTPEVANNGRSKIISTDPASSSTTALSRKKSGNNLRAATTAIAKASHKDEIIAETPEKEIAPSSYALTSANGVKDEVIKVEVPAADINPGKSQSVQLLAGRPLPQDAPVSFDQLDKNDNGPVAINADQDRTEVLNTTVSNKNKLRGIFRKVTRVVGRTTNLGPDDNDNNKGLRIANFEIALK